MLIATPTFLNGILRVAKPKELNSLRLTLTGAEKCPEYVYETFAKICPRATICEGYGVTECSPLISVNSPENPYAGTIGKVLPSMEYILIHPETRQPVERGESGVLLVRGGNVFKGYIKHDGKSPFVRLQDKEWYNTGDIVREDIHGNLVFSGRLKRFVKYGGEMISLPAVEDALSKKFPTNEDGSPVLAVETNPSEETPELTLCITVKTSREEVNQAIREAGLSALHNIRKIVEIEEIPVLGTGKTDYQKLRAML